MHDVGAAATAPTPHTPPRRAMRTPSPRRHKRWDTSPYTARAVQSAQPLRTLPSLPDDAPAVPHARTRPLPPVPAPLPDDAGALPSTPQCARPASPAPERTIFFGTPLTPEQCAVAALGGGAPTSLYDRVTPPLPHTPSSDDGSPGMARAASPTDAHVVHRSLVREALGDVSNSPRRSPLRASTSPDDKPRATSTPLRTPSRASSPHALTPVQSLLHDWAAARFAPTPQRTPGVSPLRTRVPVRPAHHDVYTSPVRTAPTSTSPERSSASTPRAASAPSAAPSPAGWAPGRSVVRRTPFTQERVPPQRVVVPLPAPPSPSKDAAVHTAGTSGAGHAAEPTTAGTAHHAGPSSAASTAHDTGSVSAPGTTLPAAADGPTPTPAPERSARLARPARYASHVPATRVWDSPEKSAKRARYAPPGAPGAPGVGASAAASAASSAGPSAAPPSAAARPATARRVPVERAAVATRAPRTTGAVRTTRHSARPALGAAGPRTPASIATEVAPVPAPAPLEAVAAVPPRPTETPAPAPASAPPSAPAPGSAQATALRARTPPPAPDAMRARPVPPPAAGGARDRTAPVPRTPRTPRRVPAPPPLSAADLARLTTKHTKQNEQYTVELHTHELRMPGARPPSPSQAFHMDARPRTPHWTQPCWTETNEYGEPVRHAQGAGDVEPYVTPPPHGARRVRWDKRLVVSPARRRAPHAPQRTCLVPTERSLDAFGNVPRTGAAGARRRTVVVKRLVYDDEDEE